MTPTAWLASLEFHGVKLGLENITLLLEALGNPQNELRLFHIAGTNGKGSTTAFIDNILRAAGYRTGRFTSPHLVHVNERFIVDGQPISDDRLNEILTRIQAVAETMPRCPTYFETTTAIALLAFAEAKVDAAILETGLGGRFDATNIVTPIATGIGPIALDHMQYLGDTLEAIAFEKAGIIKSGVPVSIAPNAPEAMAVIQKKAAESQAPIHKFTYQAAGEALAPRISYSGEAFEFTESSLGLAGAFQAHNAALAVAMVESVANSFPRVDSDAVTRGLAATRWPCRLEQVLDSPTIYIDVAHNPAGAQALADSIPNSTIILAASDDKDVRAIAEELAPKATSLILTTYKGRRGLQVEALSRALEAFPHQCAPSLEEAITLAINITGTHPIVIAGSIFAAGEARVLIEKNHGGAPLRF